MPQVSLFATEQVSLSPESFCPRDVKDSEEGCLAESSPRAVPGELQPQCPGVTPIRMTGTHGQIERLSSAIARIHIVHLFLEIHMYTYLTNPDQSERAME